MQHQKVMLSLIAVQMLMHAVSLYIGVDAQPDDLLCMTYYKTHLAIVSYLETKPKYLKENLVSDINLYVRIKNEPTPNACTNQSHFGNSYICRKATTSGESTSSNNSFYNFP